MSKPRSNSPFAITRACFLSASLTLMKAFPSSGRDGLAAICVLAKARPKSSSCPITSPVLLISGVNTIGDPGKRLKGNTDSLIAQCFGMISSVKPSSRKVEPAIIRAPSLAKGTPIALLTKGTVREARGFTSKT